jgi:hypothetical protein
MNEVPLHALTVGGELLADHCASVSYAQTLGLFLQVHRPDAPVPASARTLTMLRDTHGASIYAGTVQVLTPLLGDALTVLPDPAWPAAMDVLSAKRPPDLFFACHGEYDADDPTASRLLLGGDGGVSFEQLFADLDLSGGDCVTLGACESGLGRTLVTAEYLGLPTAFFAAGVRYVIGSLWKVNQLSAAILLGHHYRLLHDGTHTVPTALAEAQRLVRQMVRDDVRAWLRANLPQKADAWEPLIRRMDDAPFAHPYYWAGFYVAGDV